MARLFGTDGVRGVAGADLSADLVEAIAVAAVAELAPAGGSRPVVAVGRDPRPSGPWLEDAVVRGLTSAGADVVKLGVIPTPAVARAVADGLPGLTQSPAFGVVISASHNPAADNGVKLFGAGGTKLDEEVEAAIEARLAADRDELAEAGVVLCDRTGDTRWYSDALVATLDGDLGGLRVVVDCANGAASTVASAVYGAAGGDVALVNTDLGGDRINDGCGATHLDAVQAAVREAGADAGIAHDGDADRCLAITAAGDLIDGDVIMAVLAIDAKRRGELRRDAIAATVMSNLGLHKAMRAHGIGVFTTPVGDRHVAQRMRTEGLSVGGEQSGHVLLLDRATTGDGLLTALHLLRAVVRSGRSLADAAAVVHRLPQVLLNVAVVDRAAAMQVVAPLAEQASEELGDDGRVLVRASGTEPLIRVMVEAQTKQHARELAERIAAPLQ